MKIVIDDNREIIAIQEEFNAMFPYLKLEFFSEPHQQNGASPKNKMKHSGATIAECRKVHNSGNITIQPAMTVFELEQKFSKVYGLVVQVFRKSGKLWLETTITDNWTLEKQNSQGEELSRN